MVFKEQILASFLGTTFGFIFAIILFLLTNWIQNKLNKNHFKDYLKSEFQYDISLLQEWIDEFDKVLRKITASDLDVYSYFQYSLLQTYFMQESFKLGIMYKFFNNEDIFNLNKMLVHCTLAVEQFVNSNIVKWKSKQITQKEALEAFEFQQGELKKYKKHLEVLLNKLR